jgi:hypothetical protein
MNADNSAILTGYCKKNQGNNKFVPCLDQTAIDFTNCQVDQGNGKQKEIQMGLQYYCGCHPSLLSFFFFFLLSPFSKSSSLK